MAFNLSARPNVKIGLDMADFCEASKSHNLPISVIRAVDEIESAGSGFLISNKRPKILFEGHYFYRLLARHGVAEQARRLEPTICYPKWTKQHYIGREGEYGRIAKATELCHRFQLPDSLALQSASWGRYQIMGDNFRKAGYASVYEFVEEMFQDEDNHLASFLEYIENAFLIDELQKLPTNPARFAAAFAHGYNGAGYRRNQYDSKIVNAWRRFDRQKIDCAKLMRGQHVVDAMPGVRNPNPEATGFENTSFDDRYIDTQTNGDLLDLGGDAGGQVQIPDTPAEPIPVGDPEPAIIPDTEPVPVDVIAGPVPGTGSDKPVDPPAEPTPPVNQTADMITNVGGTSTDESMIKAAQALPDTVVDPKAHTGFIGKMWAAVMAIVTGQYILPDFLTQGIGNINLIDLAMKLMNGLYTFRWFIFGSLALWFVISQFKDLFLKHHTIQTNSDPKKGNVILVTPSQSGLWAWIKGKSPFS